MLRVLASVCALSLAGCGAAAGAPPSAAAEPRAIEPIEAPAVSEPVQTPQAEPPVGPAEQQAQAGVDAEPSVIDSRGATDDEQQVVRAGTVDREALVAMLDRGVARFLQRVQTRPLTAQGRFVGWRLLEFFPDDERFAGCGIGKGDTVLRVNGRSVERPESFKSVWDSLYTARELRILLLRAGRIYEVRYEIKQGVSPASAADKR